MKNSPILNFWWGKKSGANFELLKLNFVLFRIRSGSFKIFTKEEKAENKRPSPNDGGGTYIIRREKTQKQINKYMNARALPTRSASHAVTLNYGGPAGEF